MNLLNSSWSCYHLLTKSGWSNGQTSSSVLIVQRLLDLYSATSAHLPQIHPQHPVETKRRAHEPVRQLHALNSDCAAFHWIGTGQTFFKEISSPFSLVIAHIVTCSLSRLAVRTLRLLSAAIAHRAISSAILFL